ncbi:hypothetical protein INR49_026112 [Caranx melampygus]|nr:hypothetical protein INR49_026112 [Caranx melampygus]
MSGCVIPSEEEGDNSPSDPRWLGPEPDCMQPTAIFGSTEECYHNNRSTVLQSLLEIISRRVHLFVQPGEKTFTQRCRLFVGSLPVDIPEEEFTSMFAKYGKVNEVFINRERGFGFIRLETRTLAEIAKAELDGTILNNRPIRIRFATHGAALTVRNLLPVVTNELLEQVEWTPLCQLSS